MDEYSIHDSLLLRTDDVYDYAKKTPAWTSLVKSFLRSLLWGIFVMWVTIIFIYPCDFYTKFNTKFLLAIEGTLFGITGAVFLLYSGPIIVIAILAILYLIISGDEELPEKKISKSPRFRLWTFPIIVDGPISVITASELIGIFLFLAYVVWASSVYLLKNFHIVLSYELAFKEASIKMLKLMGLRIGSIGMFCMSFLFIPISRGSVLLRLIDIPFEHATRYHVWLGHLTMLIFTIHGLLYIVGWALDGCLIEEILQWKNIGIANLAGVISLLSGLLMWVTSLHPVRRQYFELFFYTHQLYVIFVVFFALHVGDFVFSISAGGIFLFMLDRFLRFWQSRKTVKILSASSLPCGTIELVLSKPSHLQYNALSFIFLQIRELSWLQWHPFSVSSSPLEGKHHMTILLKVLGEWTDKLKGNVSNILDCKHDEKQPQPRLSLTASVEGPYGHQSQYHLSYENLILIAGGIGISPFLAILSDILHRIRDGKPCMSRNILVVWAVKSSDEFPILQTLNIQTICPNHSDMLNLNIQTYVTQQSEPNLENGKMNKCVYSPIFFTPSKQGISSLVGTGNMVWSGAYVVVSIVGLIATVALLDEYYINPFGIQCWWYKGLLFVACMVASVIVFGGGVVGLWHVWDVKNSEREAKKHDVQKHANSMIIDSRVLEEETVGDSMSSLNNIHYGRRPDFKGIFKSVSDSWGCVDIGVLVCGPPSLSSSVAKECRSHSFSRKQNHPILHFHSHSFDL
ncbi:ferric reduction oxidase 7, chloroplastic-like [Impatiens glandulifera]|uniref:ferric reduction oxidase 7, chloroplastic-like n=1 Tax=Impatiens glandulifera TaxID=253017 RepID=UPI001FB0993A|nr:ferric reduction oxidase 7, chloroplastic-like [Impatiens glandulifera]